MRFLVFCCVMGVCGKHNFHSTKIFSDSPALPIFYYKILDTYIL